MRALKLKKFIKEHVLKICFLILLFSFAAVSAHYEIYRPLMTFPYGNGFNGPVAEKEKTADRAVSFKEDHKREKALYYFSMGELASLGGDVKESIIHFKKALKYDPNAAHLHARVGEEYMNASEFSLARKHLEKSLSLNHQLNDAHLLLGRLDSAEKKYKTAIYHYKRVIQLDPYKEQAYILLAAIYAELGDSSAGVKTLYVLLKTQPQSFLAYYYLGRIYAEQGKARLAAEQYEKALVLHPAFQSAATALGRYYETQDKVDKAIEVYWEAIQQGASDPGLLKRTIQLLVAKKDYRRLIVLLEELRLKEPADLNNRVRIGLVYYEMGSYQKAKMEFEQLLKEFPESDQIHFYAAAAYENLKEVDKALSSLEKITSRSRFYSEAIRHRVRLLMGLKRHKEALGVIQRELKKDPTRDEYYDVMASIYEEEQNYPMAARILEEAFEKFPKEEKLLYTLGMVYDKMGETEKSIERMERLIKLNPDHADALNFVGYTYAVHGKSLKEAERMVRKALKLKPGQGYIEDSLGWIYHIKGDYRGASKLLQRAVKLRPDEAVIADHLADNYLKLEKFEEALGWYQKALKLNPDEKTKASIQEKLNNLSKKEKIRQRFPAQVK